MRDSRSRATYQVSHLSPDILISSRDKSHLSCDKIEFKKWIACPLRPTVLRSSLLLKLFNSVCFKRPFYLQHTSAKWDTRDNGTWATFLRSKPISKPTLSDSTHITDHGKTASVTELNSAW